jgi:hypothetical protein
MPVTPADDQRHAPDSAAPEWSESWSFYFIDPRRARRRKKRALHT